MKAYFKDITEQKNWVIVTNSEVIEFETFHQALKEQKITHGNLMSKNYYEYHYKNLNNE